MNSMSTFDNENIDRLFDSLEEHSMDVELDQSRSQETINGNMGLFLVARRCGNRRDQGSQREGRKGQGQELLVSHGMSNIRTF